MMHEREARGRQRIGGVDRFPFVQPIDGFVNPVVAVGEFGQSVVGGGAPGIERERQLGRRSSRVRLLLSLEPARVSQECRLGLGGVVGARRRRIRAGMSFGPAGQVQAFGGGKVPLASIKKPRHGGAIPKCPIE